MAQALCPRLIGRRKQLDALLGALDSAADGRGSTMLVLGEAGVGKSRLLLEAGAEAERRAWPVLTGRGGRWSQEDAFGPIREALMAAFRAGPPVDEARLGPFLGALGRLVPDWAHHPPPEGAESLLPVREGVLRFMDELARKQPVLLVLEDLQGADAETLRVLEYLADNLGSLPVVCIGALRSETWSDALEASRKLAARRTATVLELERLAPAEVEEIARACLEVDVLPQDFATILSERSEGLPLLVEDLLATALAATDGASLLDGEKGRATTLLASVVPESFAHSIRRRLEALGTQTGAVLRAAAALGRDFDWTLVPPIAALDEEAVLASLRAARDAQLLTAGGAADDTSEFRFRHALTRDAIWGELTTRERAELASGALEAVEAAHPGLPGQWCELGARLAADSGQERRAAELLVEEGRCLLELGALSSAEAALRRARHHGRSDPDVLADVDEALTRVLASAGRTDDAYASGRRLLRALDELRAPTERRATMLLMLARAAVTGERWEDAEALLRECAALTEPDDARRARMWLLAAQVAMNRGRIEEAVRLGESARSLALGGSMPAIVCEALEVLGRCARLGDLERARALFEQAMSYAEEHDLSRWRLRAFQELASIDLIDSGSTERLVKARDHALQAGALARSARFDTWLAMAYIERWDAEPGLEVIGRCIDVAGRLRLERVVAFAHAQRAALLALTATPRAEVEGEAKKALVLSGDDPRVGVVVWAYARAMRSLLEEDRDRAVRELDRAMRAYRRAPTYVFGTFQPIWALLRTLAGEEAAARNEVRSSPAMVMRFAPAAIDLADAVALGRAGDKTGAEYAGIRAETLLDSWWGGRGMSDLVKRLAAEAAIADGWGQPEPWLREALAYFEESPHPAVADACRALMRRAGIPVPRRGRGDSAIPAELSAFGVTSREVDVLALLAERLTNAEIAARLHLSVRTVAKHVERLLAKTGAADRRELARLAERLGIPVLG